MPIDARVSRESPKKVLLVAIPSVSVDVPPLGPALMRTIAEDEGWTAGLMDFNLGLYKKSKHLHSWTSGGLSLKNAKRYVRILREWKQSIDQFDPDLLAISVFSHQSHCHATLALKWFKKKSPYLETVIGGAGVLAKNYGKDTFHAKMVDHYVVGEGERPFRALLRGLPAPGLDNNNLTILQDFTDVPVPNFDGLPLDEYEYPMNKKSISIEGSRGCVRNCTFCDVKSIWKKYKYKSGQRLADEMIHLSDKYQSYNFWFNDSLINGSLKVYRDFVSRLAEHNDQVVDVSKKITWSAQYIVRKVNALLEEDIRLTKLSGCHTLAIGIESGSEQVRDHMGKPFSDQDIEKTFYLLRKYDIKIFLLMIIGYPTEGKEEFKQTLDLFYKYRKYAVDGSISGVNLGNTLTILPNTPIDNMPELKITNPRHRNWTNNNSDLKLRIARRLYAQEYAGSLGYRFFDNKEQLTRFKTLMIHPNDDADEAMIHG